MLAGCKAGTKCVAVGNALSLLCLCLGSKACHKDECIANPPVDKKLEGLGHQEQKKEAASTPERRSKQVPKKGRARQKIKPNGPADWGADL